MLLQARPTTDNMRKSKCDFDTIIAERNYRLLTRPEPSSQSLPAPDTSQLQFLFYSRLEVAATASLELPRAPAKVLALGHERISFGKHIIGNQLARFELVG
jgi:hypothetical protein